MTQFVWVITKDDGNVCCPAFEIVGAFTSREKALKAYEENRPKSKEEYWRIGQWLLDSDEGFSNWGDA